MLDPWRGTIARSEFVNLLRNIFCPVGAIAAYLQIDERGCRVLAEAHPEATVRYQLPFADARSRRPPRLRSVPVRWRIALDPGHLGGDWARIEQREFAAGQDRPIREGDLNLVVAGLLAQRLREKGHDVSLTRRDAAPVTTRRPSDFRSCGSPALAARLFYRDAEIAARAELINRKLRPHLTLCLHFNAAPAPDTRPLVDDNRLLVLVHGNYLADELTSEQQRLRLLVKLLGRVERVEQPLAAAIAGAFARRTGLPPVQYPPGDPACRVGDSPYVYARNLAANRLYDGPVVYLEPYYMNNRSVYRRLQAGDYEGLRPVDGRRQPSIFREYADAVAEGVENWLTTVNAC